MKRLISVVLCLLMLCGMTLNVLAETATEVVTPVEPEQTEQTETVTANVQVVNLEVAETGAETPADSTEEGDSDGPVYDVDPDAPAEGADPEAPAEGEEPDAPAEGDEPAEGEEPEEPEETSNPILDLLDEVGDPIDVYENTYENGDGTSPIASVSIDELNTYLLEENEGTADYDFYYAFARSMGFGDDIAVIREKLDALVTEYNDSLAAYDDYIDAQIAYDQYLIDLENWQNDPEGYEEPTPVEAPVPVEEPTMPMIDVTQIVVDTDREIEDAAFEDVDGNSQEGSKVTVTIDPSAIYQLTYDGNEQVTITQPVEAVGTDFVLTLDFSGSMSSSGKCVAMLKALKTLMAKIMENPNNNVSIVVYGQGSAQFSANINGTSLSVFSSAAGLTVDDVFNGVIDGSMDVSLNDLINSSSSNATYTVERAFGIGSLTYTNNALELAETVLSDIISSRSEEGRNSGVVLFTDGEDNGSYDRGEIVLTEADLAEKYGATVVNVALGNINCRDYLDPTDDNYLYSENSDSEQIVAEHDPETEALLKERVVFYNIPEYTDHDVAEKITDMFTQAFKQITTEEVQLHSMELTQGLLTAVNTKLIETIPSTMKLVQTADDTWEFVGEDEDGNTVICWEIGDLYSGEKYSYSYFIVPLDEKTDVKGTFATLDHDTVVVTEPVDKVINAQDGDETRVAIVYHDEYEKSSDSKSTLPKTGDASVPAIALWTLIAVSALGLVASKRRTCR
ncbi:MAG: LPXTG cell wall anchor domain-containing protein [Candidatus Faecivicinus sp.]